MQLMGVQCDDDPACKLTLECMKPLLPKCADDNVDLMDSVCVIVEICTVASIRKVLNCVGMPANNIGVALGSATIIDRIPDEDAFFVHAVGDLGIAPQYPVSKINYWNNAP
jgi:hypothetical protein